MPNGNYNLNIQFTLFCWNQTKTCAMFKVSFSKQCIGVWHCFILFQRSGTRAAHGFSGCIYFGQISATGAIYPSWWRIVLKMALVQSEKELYCSKNGLHIWFLGWGVVPLTLKKLCTCPLRWYRLYQSHFYMRSTQIFATFYHSVPKI